MAFIVKDRVKETTTTTGTGTLTLAGAVTGFRSFADVGNANTCPYVLLEGSESAPTAWEVGIGTYTASGTTLARTTVLANSSGTTSAITLGAGTHTVFVGWAADYAQGSSFAQQALIPGGRLTLESGVPVSTTDQTAKTTVYYTPYVHNVISLWTGARWKPVEFSETSLALGTLTSGKPYDVFAYLSSGVLTLEALAWTSDSARATAITFQDGRLCKSGDKTRLYLGSFYTTSTTTTEDSEASRYLFNQYNRAAKRLFNSDTNSHTYTTASAREWNNGANSTSRIRFFSGEVAGSVLVGFMVSMLHSSSGITGYVGIGINSTTTVTGAYAMANSVTNFRTSGAMSLGGSLGLNYVAAIELGATGVTYESVRLGGSWLC